MYRRLGQFVVGHRTWLLPSLGLLAVACAAFIPQLTFSFTPEQFFQTDSDLGEYREEFASTFSREDNLTAIVVSGGDVFEPDVLGTIRDVTLELRESPPVDRAESIATFPVPRAGDGPGSMSVEPLLPQRPSAESGDRDDGVDPALARRLETLAMDEPLVRKRLVGESGRSSVILAWLDRQIQEVSELKRAETQIRAELEDHPLPEDLEYTVGGVPPLRIQIIDALRSEQVWFIPLTGAVYLVVLLLLFRRPSGVVLPIAVVLMAVAATVAVLVATDSSLNVVNNVLPTIIFIIGIADSIHMLTRHAEEVDSGRSGKKAAERTVEITGFACLMTSTTTAIGFLSLVWANTDILKNFGWQAAAGVMLAYFFTLFFLPAGLSFMRPVDRRATPEDDSEWQPLEGTVMIGARRVLAHPWKFVVGSLGVCALAGWSATWVDIDATLLEVFRKGHPSYATTNMIEKQFGGFLPFEVSLESDREGRFRDPEIYRKLHAFQQDAANESPVLSTQSIVDFHQSARAALLGDPAERSIMPESRDQIRQLHLLISGAPDAATGPNQYVTRDFSKARVLLRVADVGAKRQLELAEDLRAKLETHFGDVSDVRYRLTGDAYVASVALDSFIRDLFYSLLFAGFVIFGLMALIFRSIKLGLVSIIPNATPLLVTLGYMGIQGIDLNSSTVIIFAIGLGLAVDDTIHVLARFREEKREGYSTRRAVVRTYFGAGRAIVLTSLLLLIGLTVLVFSDFIPTRQFGELTSVTILAAIMGDLLLLPPLLLLVFGDES